jgi:hypothetical protein
VIGVIRNFFENSVLKAIFCDKFSISFMIQPKNRKIQPKNLFSKKHIFPERRKMRVFAIENRKSSQNPRNTRPHSPTNYARNYPRPSSPTQSHSHSQAQSREVLSDSSTPIAENWCVTKVPKRPSFNFSYSVKISGQCPEVFVQMDDPQLFILQRRTRRSPQIIALLWRSDRR